MRFPSTLLAQIVDKKDPKDVEREIQKADLDLLSKINQIAGGGILSLSQQGYTEKAADAYSLIDVTTGANTQTITLVSAKQVLLRTRTYSKADGAAGEVKLQCSDPFFYPGGTATAIYIGLQYQSVTLLAVAGGYRIVAGVVQPVAGEPDIGGGWHEHYAILVSSVPGSDAVQTKDCSAVVPLGARLCSGRITVSSAANARELNVYDTTGTNIYDTARTQNNGTATASREHWEAPLDTSRVLRWATSGFATITSVEILLTHYALGPV